MSTLIRPLVPTMEFGLRFDMKRIPNSIGLLILMLLMSIAASAQSDATLSCYGRVNMSITNSGLTYIKPVHVTGRKDLSNLEVSLQDRSIPRVRCSDIGEVIMFTLRDTVNDISCWGELYIEDKLPYSIIGNDGTAPCSSALSSLDPSDFITIDDNCLSLSDLQIVYVDSIGSDFPMGSDTLRLVTRTWTTTGPSGLTRTSQSNIYILPFDLDDIEFPSDTTISCELNPLDTAFTGGLNVSAELLKENCCIGFSIESVQGPLLFACGTKKKYVRNWEAFDWCKGTMKSKMQIIIVEADAENTKLIAPTSFTRVDNGCQPGLILGSPTVETDCADFTIEHTEVFITSNNEVITAAPTGDTVYLDPGEYQFIYRPNATCINTIINDTVDVTVSSVLRPVLTCSDSLNKIISIGAQDSLIIDFDQVYRNANIQACGAFNVLGRKLNTAGVATTVFDSLMTLYISEASAKLQVELTVKSANGLYSDTCIVWIDVQENVPPSLTLFPNIDAPIVDVNGMVILDTSDIISSLTDNSGCISSIAITGSGSVMTGSGTMMTGSLTWFMNGGFQEFDCSDVGTYNVKVAVTDCDNNMTMDTTTLTISDGGGCPMPGMVSGQVLAYGDQPISGVQVSLLSSSNAYLDVTDIDGQYGWEHIEGGQEYEIELDYTALWRTGLSANDLSLLQYYVLGLEEFDMYQKASADIDGNEVINVSDFISLQKILLGQEVKVTLSNDPWVFSNRVEDGRLIPFEGGSIRADGGHRLNWQAIKSGDVDRDALKVGETRSLRNVKLQHIASSSNGHEYKMSFGNAQELRAFQGVVDFGLVDFEIISRHEEIDLRQIDNKMTVLYYDKEPRRNSQTDLDLLIRTNEKIVHLDFDQDVLSSYAWDHSGDKTKMYLQLENGTNESQVEDEGFRINAYPNPTSDGVTLELSNNGKEQPVDIIVTDVLGAVYLKQSYTIQPNVNNNQINISLPEQSGIYIISTQSSDNQQHIRISKK